MALDNKSLVSSANYLTDLNSTYSKAIVLYKNNVLIPTGINHTIEATVSYFDKVELIDKELIIKAPVVIDSNTSMLAELANIVSEISAQIDDAIILNSSAINGTDLLIDISVSTDSTILRTLNIKVKYGSVLKYDLDSTSNEYIQILTNAGTINNEIFAAIIDIYNHVIPNIEEILLVNDKASEVSSNTLLVSSIKDDIIAMRDETIVNRDSSFQSASNSNTSAINAEASNQSAISARDTILAIELQAEGFADNAEASKNLAEKWANEEEDVVVSNGKYSAKHWALKSKELSALVALNISYDNTESGLSSSTTQDAIDELDNNLDNLSANVYTKSEINSSLATKVDNVIGKQLSTEDFTTAEKNKLIGIAIGANNYTLQAATSTEKGGVELYSDTVQTVASNAVTNTASRTYGLQFNSAGQAVVNVPWVDTNTIYTHPTTDGSLHVPATSTTNNGKVLMAGATAGVFAWSTLPNVTTTTAGYMLAADKVKLDGIAVNANNYVHPSTHDASIIAVTDTFNNSNGSTVQIVLDDLDNAIDVQKGRIDAILTASTADKDTFSEIVTLINSVDTTNDTIFAGYVDTNNTRSTTIETNITNLTNNKVDKTNNQALHATDALRVSGKTISLYKGDGTFETIGTQDTVYTHPVSGATAGTYKSVTVDINGHVTSGTNPTTVSGYGLTDVYTKTEVNSMIPTTLPASDVYAWAKVAIKPKYTASEVGLENVTNESKSTMFTSPTFTGTPVAPTAAVGTNTTQVATTAYVIAEINKIEEW